MLAGPSNAKTAYAIRFATVGLAALVLVFKAQDAAKNNTLAIYLGLIIVLMILSQTATQFRKIGGKLEIERDSGILSRFDIFLIYSAALMVMISRSIFGLQVPNAIFLLAIVIAFGSGVLGLVFAYQLKRARSD